jgi:hypothetical protein
MAIYRKLCALLQRISGSRLWAKQNRTIWLVLRLGCSSCNVRFFQASCFGISMRQCSVFCSMSLLRKPDLWAKWTTFGGLSTFLGLRDSMYCSVRYRFRLSSSSTPSLLV